MKTAAIAFAVTAAIASVAEAQVCNVPPCVSANNHNLFIERQYRDFLLQRYPSYGSRYRGMRPDISIGPGATVGGPLPGTANRARLRQRPNIHYDANAHLRWCLERYLSYRPSDNTFQPFDGPRRSCHSPHN